MNANIEGMIRAAATAYRRGDKAEARALLERVIDLDQYNEDAWLWLSNAVESVEEQRTCLENVLIINPNNDRARAGLRNLGIDVPASTASSPAASSAPEPSSVFTDTSFTGEGSADIFGDADFDNVDRSWSDSGIATSSASAVYQGPELTNDDYDSWVDNLGISSQKTAEPETAASPFGAGFDASVFGYDIDEDSFGAGSEPASPAPTTYSQPEPSSPYLGVSLDEEDEDAPSLMGGRQAAASPILSSFDDSAYAALDPAEVELDLEENEIDPAEFFLQIPADIGPGRLPGTRERVSMLLVLGVVLLLGLNIVAGVLLVQGA